MKVNPAAIAGSMPVCSMLLDLWACRWQPKPLFQTAAWGARGWGVIGGAGAETTSSLDYIRDWHA